MKLLKGQDGYLSYQLKSGIVFISSIIIVFLLLIPSYKSIKEKSLQAEAKVMLSYLASLEIAYHTDNGKYVLFNEYYGAPILGIKNCHRPQGAIDLGFEIKHCQKQIKVKSIKYAYRVSGGLNPQTLEHTDNNMFIGFAESGSFGNGLNFVCTNSKSKDIWKINKAKTTEHIVRCKN